MVLPVSALACLFLDTSVVGSTHKLLVYVLGLPEVMGRPCHMALF